MTPPSGGEGRLFPPAPLPPYQRRFGTSVSVYVCHPEVDEVRLDDAYVVHCPLGEGRIEVQTPRHQVTTCETRAAILGPGDRMVMRWATTSPALIVRFAAPALQARLGRLLGSCPREPLEFDVEQSLTTPRMRQWRALLELAVQDDVTGADLLTHPVAQPHLGHVLSLGLLLAATHSHSDRLADGPSAADEPGWFRDALRWIERYASEPVTPSQIARAAGVRPRTLFRAFRRYRGVSPGVYVDRIRVRMARQKLLAAGDGGTVRVTDVAFACGFESVDRFRRHYARTFDELPSDTVRGRVRRS